MIWLERNDARIFAEELRTRLKLKSMRQCLEDRRLQWFGHLERMEKNASSSKCGTSRVSGIFAKGRLRKTWNEEITRGLKKGKSART